MKQFILFNTSKDNYSILKDVFKSLIGSYIDFKEEDNLLICYSAEFSFEEIVSTIKSLENDLNISITTYISSHNDLDNELRIVKKIFMTATHGYYDFSKLLMGLPNVPNQNDILDYILDGSGIDEKILLGMAYCDLNVSQASKYLYMHRNTLLYKIDRLKELKKLDIRKFNDLYIIMRLIKQ